MEKVRTMQTKYQNMRKAYEELNEELKQDIPKLVGDKSSFYSPLFAMLVYHQLEYYKGSSSAVHNVGNSISHIDTQSCHQHVQVITPEDQSAHTMPINFDAPVEEDGELDSTNHSSHQEHQEYQQPPPQQNYQQPPPPQQNYQQQPPPPQQQNVPPQRSLPPQTQPKKGGPPPKKMGGPPPKKMGGNPVKKLPPRNKTAKGLYPFQGQDSSELSFNVGDVLIIHNMNGEWWEAELNGQRGMIPANYIQLL